jgi:hypothetical protein
MGFDEVDADSAAPGRIDHAEVEQGIDIAGFGIGKAAPDQEFRALLANGTHSFPLTLC